jgi:glutamine synthetase
VKGLWTTSLVGSEGRHFLRNKRQEWEEYRSEVTAFELRKNLPVL